MADNYEAAQHIFDTIFTGNYYYSSFIVLLVSREIPHHYTVMLYLFIMKQNEEKSKIIKMKKEEKWNRWWLQHENPQSRYILVCMYGEIDRYLDG